MAQMIRNLDDEKNIVRNMFDSKSLASNEAGHW